MDEQAIIRHLLTFPREMREHLVAVYSDGAALFSELIKKATTQEVIDEMKRQQAVYLRIAKTLMDTLSA